MSKLARYGVSPGFAITTQTTVARRQNLDAMVAVGAKVVRVDITATGTPFVTVDPVVDDCLARGLDVWLVLYGTTGPRSVDTFGHDVAAHYVGKVENFEICNEPDINGWTANQYADFVSGTSDSIRTAQANATISAGALWKGGGLGSSTDPKSFAVALCTRATQKFNILSMHLYDESFIRANWNIWDWALEWGGTGWCDAGANGGTVRKALNDNGHSNVPILCSESAIGLPGGTLTDQATGVDANIKQVAAGQIAAYFHFEMMMFDTTNQYSLLDATNAIKPNYTAYLNQAKKFIKTKGIVS